MDIGAIEEYAIIIIIIIFNQNVCILYHFLSIVTTTLVHELHAWYL